MKLHDLVHQLAWPVVEARLTTLYPREAERLAGYERVIEILRSLSPRPSAMRIVVEEVPDDVEEGGTVIDVAGRDGTTVRDLPEFKTAPESFKNEDPNREVSYSMSLTAWDEWLNMEIDPRTCERFSAEDILAHCLWEMTFYGFSMEAIGTVRDSLMASARELEAMTEEERRQQTLTWDDLKKSFEKTDDYP